MFCNGEIIPEFTKEQIAECQKCKYASAKKRFCSNPAFAVFGDVWIRESGKIITPSRKILKPFPKNQRAYNKKRFQRNYAVAAELCKRQEIIGKATFVKRRKICAMCPPAEKSGCSCIGCKQWQKLVLKELKCPKGKW